MFYVPGNWSIVIKAVFLPWESWIVSASNLPKKNTLENFSLHYTAMATYVSFIKETGYFPVLAGKSPDFRNSQTEGNNSYCSQH